MSSDPNLVLRLLREQREETKAFRDEMKEFREEFNEFREETNRRFDRIENVIGQMAFHLVDHEARLRTIESPPSK